MSQCLWTNRKASPSNAAPPQRHRDLEEDGHDGQMLPLCELEPLTRWPRGSAPWCTPPLLVTARGWFCRWFRKNWFQTFVSFFQPRRSSSPGKLRKCFLPHPTASGIERIRTGTNPPSLPGVSFAAAQWFKAACSCVWGTSVLDFSLREQLAFKGVGQTQRRVLVALKLLPGIK